MSVITLAFIAVGLCFLSYATIWTAIALRRMCR
jgi:hypothetical protein